MQNPVTFSQNYKASSFKYFPIIKNAIMFMCSFPSHSIDQASAILQPSGNIQSIPATDNVIKQEIQSLVRISWANTMKSISDMHGYDVYKILKRNLPDIFVNDIHEGKNNYSNRLLGVENILKGAFEFDTELDLFGFDLKTIPEFIYSRMEKVKKLDLSGNPKLKFDDEWFKNMPKENIETFIYKNERKDSKPAFDINIIREFPNLETLVLTPPSGILTMSPGNITSNLERLECLDISGCHSVSETLVECIFNNCKKLKSLNLSNIPLKSYFSSKSQRNLNLTDSDNNIISVFKNVESLDLSKCSLDASCLKEVFKLPALKKINLSSNSFGGVNSDLVNDLFKKEEDNSLQCHELPFENSCLNNLEEIDLSQTCLHSVDFIRKLLDLKTIKSLTLVQSAYFSLSSIGKLFEPFPVTKYNKIPESSDGTHTPQTNPVSIENGLEDIEFRNYQSEFTLKTLVITGLNIQNKSKFISFLEQFKSLETLDISFSTLVPNYESFSFGSLVDTLTSLKVNGLISNARTWNSLGLSTIASFKKLKHLEAKYTEFINLNSPIKFESQDTLESINLSNSKINQFGFASCLNCKKLKKLILSKSSIPELPLTSIVPNLSLEELDVGITRLTSEQFDKILSSFPKLKVINALNCSFLNFSDNFRFKKIPDSLTQVNLGSSPMNIHFFTALTHLPLSDSLRIYDCNFSANTNMKFGPGIHSLKKLKILNSQINANFLNALSAAKNLESLHLYRCSYISSSDLNLRIGTFYPALKKLILEHVQSPDLLLSIFRNAPKLEYFEIKNPLTGVDELLLSEQIKRLKSQNPKLKLLVQ